MKFRSVLVSILLVATFFTVFVFLRTKASTAEASWQLAVGGGGSTVRDANPIDRDTYILQPSGGGGADLIAAKTAEEWTRQFGSPAADIGLGVATDSNANSYTAGYTLGPITSAARTYSFESTVRMGTFSGRDNLERVPTKKQRRSPLTLRATRSSPVIRRVHCRARRTSGCVMLF